MCEVTKEDVTPSQVWSVVPGRTVVRGGERTRGRTLSHEGGRTRDRIRKRVDLRKQPMGVVK